MAKEEKAEEKKKAAQKPKAKKPAMKEAPKEAPKAEVPKPVAAPAHKPEVPKAAAPTKAAAPMPAPKPEVHPAPARKEPKKKKTAPKKVTRAFVARGKRKESVARASIKAGKGVIRVNMLNISAINNPYIREIIREPLRYVGPEANNVDISVNINGGGMMGQAQAARTAIAHALMLYFDQMNLRDKFLSIDRSMVIEDTRRVETKKFRGPKARARFQKSYR
ncbi:MAG: 30S ribosomal protein S9 [Candidatus ainarchaeum sp.]|nr:30S ribosomal protein S9 [Candidatus ainarchaeum sp.]